jgi:hypothetical protein
VVQLDQNKFLRARKKEAKPVLQVSGIFLRKKNLPEFFGGGGCGPG